MLKSVAIALVALASLAACSSAKSTDQQTAAATSAAPAPVVTAALQAATTGNPNPCSLLTTDEVTKALGSTPSAGTYKKQIDGDISCRWYDASKTRNVYVAFVGTDTVEQLAKLGAKPVSGVGDKAYFSSGSLLFEKGGQGVQVGVLSAQDTAAMQTMDPKDLVLAQAAASRL